MAYFSARARKVAWDTASPSNNFDDDDGSSSITGGISRRSTGDTNISTDSNKIGNSHSHKRSRSLCTSPEPTTDTKYTNVVAAAAVVPKPFHEALEEKRKTKHLLERRVVSFPLEEDARGEADGDDGAEQQQKSTKRISRGDSIERFIAALDQHGEVIVESTVAGDVDMKFEAID